MTAGPTKTVSDSRERIRTTALRLFAAQGAAATSLREVAREAGVAPGLVVHHFGGKEGLRAAVDDSVVDLFREAVDSVSLEGPVDEVIAVDYLRRAVVTPDPGAEGLSRMLIEETIRRTQILRDHGIARSRVPVEEQAVGVLVRQLGALLLQPALERLWGMAQAPAPVPTVRVSVQRPGA